MDMKSRSQQVLCCFCTTFRPRITCHLRGKQNQSAASTAYASYALVYPWSLPGLLAPCPQLLHTAHKASMTNRDTRSVSWEAAPPEPRRAAAREPGVSVSKHRHSARTEPFDVHRAFYGLRNDLTFCWKDTKNKNHPNIFVKIWRKGN